MKNIKMITFDLDDTLWDNMPTITKAELETIKWIEDQLGKVEWGDFNDFIKIREELISNCIKYVVRFECGTEKVQQRKSKAKQNM